MAASTTDKASFMGSAGFFAGSFLGFGLGFDFDFVMPHDARAAVILPAAHNSNFTSTFRHQVAGPRCCAALLAPNEH